MHTRITNSFGGRGTLVVNKVWHDVKAAVAKAPPISRLSCGASPMAHSRSMSPAITSGTSP